MFSCFMPCYLCLDLLFPMFFRSTCFHVSYHVFVPRSIFPTCCSVRSTCFYACLHVFLSFLHALCFMPCLDPSLLCVDVGSTCPHAWYHAYGYALLSSTCLYACFVLLCLCLCLPRLVCLDLFFHAFMLASMCLDLCLHAYMHISMLICVDRCVYMLRSMFSICFVSSSICLRASRHIYVLRPRPWLSCHVLL